MQLHSIKRIILNWLHSFAIPVQPQEFNADDLLQRSPIVLQPHNISRQIRDRIILITGAAGSIGSELAKQICAYEPARLFLLDQAESALYELQYDLEMKFPSVDFHTVIADITDQRRMEHVFSLASPQMVFHAAAYKHVPLMEKFPEEAIKTNVFGTRILADLSERFRIEKFIFVSTDKALDPASVMGATKRLAEMYLSHVGHTSQTKFIITRFGNVLGSNGSVFHIFRKQIKAGGPVTITQADATRYFMTVSEACQLVLEAGAMAQNGEIVAFDMGQPIKIITLAKRMIKLSGLRPRDIPIVITGHRPGDKLHEALLKNEASHFVPHHSRILITHQNAACTKEITSILDQLTEAIYADNTLEMLLILKQAVPEYNATQPNA